MPQFDLFTFSSQIFWVFIFSLLLISLLLFLVSRSVGRSAVKAEQGVSRSSPLKGRGFGRRGLHSRAQASSNMLKQVNPDFKPKAAPSADVKNHTFGLFSGDGTLGAHASGDNKKGTKLGPLAGISYRLRISLKNLAYNRAMLLSLRRDWGIGTCGPFKSWVYSEKRGVYEWYYGFYWQVGDMDEVYFFLKSYAASPLIGFSWRTHRKVVRILSSMEQHLLWGAYKSLLALEESGSWSWIRPEPVRLISAIFAFSALWCFEGILFIPLNDRSYIFYMLGFVEAEGCFSTTSRDRKTPERCFHLAQTEDRLILDSVKSFFLITRSRVLKSKGSVNFPETFFTIASGDLRVNFRVVEHFKKYTFKGDKIRSFREFEAVVLKIMETNITNTGGPFTFARKKKS